MKERARAPYVTVILICIMALIFILDFFVLVPVGTKIFSASHLMRGQQFGLLTQYGGMVPELFGTGQYWRAVTALFLNRSVVTFVVNVIALFLVGAIVEPPVGSWKTLLVFFLAGILTNVAFIFFMQTTVGSWGGTFGLIGMLLVLLIRRRDILRERMTFLEWIAIAVYIAVLSLNGVSTMISAAIGLATGLIFGFIFVQPERAAARGGKKPSSRSRGSRPEEKTVEKSEANEILQKIGETSDAKTAVDAAAQTTEQQRQKEIDALVAARDAGSQGATANAGAVKPVAQNTALPVADGTNAATEQRRKMLDDMVAAGASAEAAAKPAVSTTVQAAQNIQNAPAQAAQNVQDAPAQAAQNYQNAPAQVAHNFQNAPTQAAQNVQSAPTQAAQNVQNATAQAAQNVQNAPAQAAPDSGSARVKALDDLLRELDEAKSE